MTHRTMLEPIVVTDTPEQITPLQAALDALNSDVGDKYLYLPPSVWKALRDYVAELEEITEAAAKLMFDYRGSYSDIEDHLIELLTIYSVTLEDKS